MRPSVKDLQTVFGPPCITFESRELDFDLNRDGNPERIVFFVPKGQGHQWSRNMSLATETGGISTSGFVVFDGVRPNVPVFYAFNEYDGVSLRFDQIDGQQVLVSDGTRDHIQHVWGWWRYPECEVWDGWEARSRRLALEEKDFSEWSRNPNFFVIVGKDWPTKEWSCR